MAEEYQQQQQQSNICSNWWSNGSSTNNQSGRSSNGYDQSGSGSAGDHSVSVSGSSSSMMFLNTNQKLPGTAPGLSLSGGDGGGCGVLVDPNMQVIGLGLSQRADWDQTLLRGGKADQSSFRSMLEEDHISSSSNFQQEIQWKPGKIFTGHGEESSLNRSGFSLEQQQQQFSSPVEEHSTITCHNLSTGYMENPQSIVYGGGSPSSMLQSLLGSNSSNQQQPQQQQNFFDQRAMDDYSYGTANYGMNSNESQFMPPSDFSSNNKFAQFTSNSPPKPQQQHTSQNQLQFSNNAPYWNARVGPSSFMSSLQPHQFPAAATARTNSSFEEKPNNKNNVVKELVNKDSSVVKKSGSEASSKRPRNESSPSTALPPFKVKKEKMGDRITALQQLVSPFGKTDTASVLSESIEYIKILHEQVLVLTAPYLKNGAMMQLHHQHLEKSSSKDYSKGPKQDLRSRGLCLVPLSSTFPVTHETSVDFWTPTFGGPLR
ncbi:unnamed protein product [Rhodiola kirilowii]